MRSDLLALTSEDLELFSNKGTVRRAASEVNDGEPALLAFEEGDGGLKFSWADSAVCSIGANADVRKGVCSCSSATICRHLIRSVLCYQKLFAQSNIENENGESVAPASAVDNFATAAASGAVSEKEESTYNHDQGWWPGDISDEQIAERCRKTATKAADALFDKGQVVRLSGGARPRAQFLSISHTVRFLVPLDIRYAVCDCSDDSPCAHAVLAVKCFRMANVAESIQYLETYTPAARDIDALREIEASLNALFVHGIASRDKEAVRLLSLSREHCVSKGFYFMAELFEEILLLREQIIASDASVLPESIMQKVAELLIRIDVASDRQEVARLPVSLVLGGEWNAPIPIKVLSLTALGLEARQQRKETQLICHFVDTKNGQLCRVTRTIDHAQDTNVSLPSFAELARLPLLKANSIADLSASSIVVRGGKLSPSRQLTIGRNPVAINPQDYDWSKLHSSVFFEVFDELVDSLVDVHPPYLSSRGESVSLRVAAIGRCAGGGFNYAHQCLTAQIYDKNGTVATLKLPYRTRAARGFEMALQLLTQAEYSLEFVSGLWSSTGFGLEVRPLTMVFSGPGGRVAVQPDIGRALNFEDKDFQSNQQRGDMGEERESGLLSVLPSGEVLRCLGTLLEKGLLRPDPIDLRMLDELRSECVRLGSSLLLSALDVVISLYERRASESGDSAWRQELLSSVKKLAVLAFVIERESAAMIEQSFPKMQLV